MQSSIADRQIVELRNQIDLIMEQMIEIHDKIVDGYSESYSINDDGSSALLEDSSLLDEEYDYLLSQLESLEIQLNSVVGELNYVSNFCSDTEIQDLIIDIIESSLVNNSDYSNDIVEGE